MMKSTRTLIVTSCLILGMLVGCAADDDGRGRDASPSRANSPQTSSPQPKASPTTDPRMIAMLEKLDRAQEQSGSYVSDDYTEDLTFMIDIVRRSIPSVGGREFCDAYFAMTGRQQLAYSMALIEESWKTKKFRKRFNRDKYGAAKVTNDSVTHVCFVDF